MPGGRLPAPGRAGRLGRSGGRPHDQPARQGDDPRLRQEDGQGDGRLRGQPHVWGRGRDRGDDRRGGDVRPRRTDRADRRPGRPRDGLREQPRARVHAQRRRDRRADARARPVLASTRTREPARAASTFGLPLPSSGNPRVVRYLRHDHGRTTRWPERQVRGAAGSAVDPARRALHHGARLRDPAVRTLLRLGRRTAPGSGRRGRRRARAPRGGALAVRGRAGTVEPTRELGSAPGGEPVPGARREDAGRHPHLGPSPARRHDGHAVREPADRADPGVHRTGMDRRPRAEDPQGARRDRDRVLAALYLADRTGEPLTIEFRHIRKDGTVIWVHEETVTIERDREGRPSLSQGVMYDVTERKRAEQDLAETEARYRTLVERVPAVTYTWDAALRGGDTAASFISPQVEEMLGYSAEEFRDPLLWSKLVHRDDLRRVQAEWATCKRGKGTFRSEYRMRTRDGRELWVRDEAVPVRRDDDGQALYQGVMFDITERKVAEQLLQKAEANYRTLVEQLPVVVYQDAIDDVSTALYISPQYERLFGFPPGARLRDPQFWVDHLHPEDRDRVIELSKWTNETGEPFSAEYRFLGRDGRVVWVRDEAELLRDAEGQPMMWQGVLLDVTARKHAEDALTRRAGPPA